MPHAPTPRELTLRGLILGAVITVIFTASNVYLGLRIGLTFASSIPAAVISMAVLRALGNSSLLENNMVQSQASAAGTLSCVFATFPGLIMAGIWSNFPFWQTAGISLAGGIAGVLFTIPLRRALVTESSLPYPEGVAAAEILRAGGKNGNTKSLKALVSGGVIAALFTFASNGLRVVADSVSATASLGGAIFQATGGLSLALIGAGYLVGVAGGLAMLVGCIMAWGVGVPWLTAHTANTAHLAAAEFAHSVWLHKIRFVGAGAIAMASVWTLIELIGPVARGLRAMLHAHRTPSTTEQDKDLSPRSLIALLTFTVVALGVLFSAFLAPVAHGIGTLVVAAVLFCVVFGFVMAAACGYMAGIVGSSSSPISGIVIIAAVLSALMILGLEACGLVPDALMANGQTLATGFTILVLSAITAIAAISNDNLQDLKTGQLVGASPWKQQVALLAGCVVGAAVIPPVLNILYQAYGFAGAMPRPGMDAAHALSAPQPALIALIAKGVFTQSLDWSMLSLGMGLGVVLVILDLALRRRALALPPLGVAVGLYLPPSVSITLALGALLGWFAKRHTMHNKRKTGAKTEVSATAVPEHDATVGTMLASGFIVGESLTGVGLAIVAGALGAEDPLSLAGWLPHSFAPVLGLGVFSIICVWFYRRVVNNAVST
ncbi:OPT family oligopeptide transporter [Acetobacter orientalis]|uniref:OPT family oligopeptide transporter n=1 Tax=Acetobacter orientalis TaxID=146474 RepID=UPI0039E82C74